METAAVIGSGPNGLAASIVLAAAGYDTTIFERNNRIGGACATAETTLPGYKQDLGSSVYPLGKASPFFRSLPIDIPWVEPDAACAHPLDDGTAILLEHSIDATLDHLDACDRQAYRAIIEPLVSGFADLIEEILQPIQHLPHHPLLMGRFGAHALLPAETFARSQFEGKRAQALFAGVSTHAILPLNSFASAAIGLIFLSAGHATGWPIVRSGAQSLANALGAYLRALGGTIVCDHEIREIPQTNLVLADVSPRQLITIAGESLPTSYLNQLSRFRYGSAAFKIDYALSSPIPWRAPECSRAATVHVGGSFEEIVEAERTLTSSRPFVLVGQPSLFDSSRAPAGRHTAWAYCHVPNGSDVDYTKGIEDQISRFAPAFRECILSRAVSTPSDLQNWNPNLIGGDILSGRMDFRQLLLRPTRSLYRTPKAGLYLCGASTPPGGGVHGMCGFHAARLAITDAHGTR
jgi:phytoene dehydrogenase-like protein